MGVILNENAARGIDTPLSPRLIIADAVGNIGVGVLGANYSYLIRKYGGSWFAPSDTTCFADSAGSIPTAKDGPVGCIVDSARGLGAELMINGDFSNGTTAWGAQNGSTISAVSGGVKVDGGVWGGVGGSAANTKLIVGKAYLIEFDVVEETNAVAVSFNTGGTSYGSFSTGLGKKRMLFVCNSASVVFLFTNNATGVGYKVLDNISVREVLGGIATQATTGFKPILRKGAKNLLTFSEDLTNGAWTKIGATATASVITEDTSAALHCVVRYSSWLAGVTCTFRARVKAGTATKCAVINASAATLLCFDLSSGVVEGAIGNISGTITPASDGYYEITATHTAAAAQTLGICTYRTFVSGNYNATAVFTGNGSTLTVTNTQLETGSTASPYVATTTAPASNGIGNWWLDFDGVDDRLQLSAVPFQMSDDHFVVAGAARLTTAAVGAILSIGSSASSNQYASYRASTDITAALRDDTGASTVGTSGGSGNGITAGGSFVATYRNVGTAFSAKKNGGSANTGTEQGAYTLNQAAIGGLYRQASLADPFLGPIYAIALGKASEGNGITDSELRIVEREVARLSGVTL